MIDSMYLWGVALIALLFTIGCGASAMKVNATIAKGMLELQAEAGPKIREMRIESGVAAAGKVQLRGGSQAEAESAAIVAANRWKCAIDGHTIYAQAVGAYIDALSLWAQGTDFSARQALPFVRRAVEAYAVLHGCLKTLGDNILPVAPAFLELIPADWRSAR